MDEKRRRQNRLWWIAFGLLVLVFTLAYAQSPLFTSNQNQYFIHGMAKAGFGDLEKDWLNSTADIVPVFSFLVFLTYSLFHATWVFYLWYVLIFAIYLYALYGILSHIFKWENTLQNLLIFGAAAIFIHSAALRFAISTLLSPDWEYILEGGVAGQRVLGDVFQPSSFGVLFLLSITLFLKEKTYWAVAIATIAAVIHPTYLLSAAILTATYGMIRLIETKNIKETVLIGLLALVIVAGIVVYTASIFLGASPAMAAQANDITIHYRQPHHMLIEQWLDGRVVVKAILVAVALAWIRKTKLFWILLPSTVMVVGLTLLQAWIKSPALAMLFPWRFSVILVPLATMILTAKALDGLFMKRNLSVNREKWLHAVLSLLVLVCAVLGIYKFTISIRTQHNNPAYSMMTMIRDQYEPGQVIVVPLKWQEFRLVTGIPIVVEFKAGPQSPADIVEWYERVQQVDHLYAGLPNGEGCFRWEYLQSAYGATHLVLPNDLEAELDCMTLVFTNGDYSFYAASQVQ